MTELGLAAVMRETMEDRMAEREVRDVFSESAEMRDNLRSVMIQEGVSGTDLELALEDRGWVRADAQNTDGMTPQQRKSFVFRARAYWLLDPHATAAVRTWTNYTVGTGVSFKATDTTLDGNLQTFWKSPKNRTMTSSAAQQKHNRRLLVDGELFFAVFDDDPAPTIRKVDCNEITAFVYDPEDAEVVWAYRREQRLPNGDTNVRFYRSWAYPEQDLSGIQTTNEAGVNTSSIKPESGVLMYHMAFDAMHQRGNSLFASSMAWFTAMRNFMGDRVAITKGLAKYISKLTIKGGQNQVNKVGAALNNQVRGQVPALPASPTGVAYNNAPQVAAKTFLENDNVALTNMPRTTGASDSRQDYKNLRLQFTAGLGMSEPYWGDAESGNLATATAMELPMLKQFQTHQTLWADAWRDLFTIVSYFMGDGNGEMEPVDVDVDYPPIVEADIAKITTAIVEVCAEFPELKQPEVLKLLLVTMGLNNIEDIMSRVIATQAEMKANVAKGLNADGSQPTPVVQPAKPVQQKTVPGGQPVAKTMQEAVEALHEALSQEVVDMAEHAEV